jgi:hypothetical protein
MSTPTGGPASSSAALGSLDAPIRTAAAWILLAYSGVIVAFALFRVFFPEFPMTFVNRAGGFTTIEVLVFPLLAVLVGTWVGGVVPGARLLTLLAVVIYGVALVFGTLWVLGSVGDQFGSLGGGIHSFGGVVRGIGRVTAGLLKLALFGVAALWTLRIYRSLGGRPAAPGLVDLA